MTKADSKPLPASYYLGPDPVAIARDLLGRRLVTEWEPGYRTSGIIVETEAYGGASDRASHAWNNRRTRRTEMMFRAGGIAYVYLCYGIHSMFNVVTGPSDNASAVLIRAIEPDHGIPLMLSRRGMKTSSPRLTAGPGCLAEALGIHHRHSGTSLLHGPLWIEAGPPAVKQSEIVPSARVGVAYAGEDAKRPWRFRIKGSRWTSRAK